MKPPVSTPGAALLARQDRADLNFRRLLVGAVGLVILVLLSASIAAIVLLSESQDITRWVNHTYQAERVVSDMRVGFSQVEAARRGYLITHDPAYMNAYRQSANALPSQLERFAALTADNPRQQAAAVRFQPLLTAKLNEQQTSLQAAAGDSRGRLDPAMLIREDQASSDRIRTALNAMMDEEGRLLDERSATQSTYSELLLIVVLSSSVLVAVLAAGAFLLVRRYASDLDRSQQALKQLNTGLEDEVGRRTADLTRANEEIQRFAYIVSHDLRSPLVNVMGFTSELETATKPLRELVTRLKTEAPHLLTRQATEAVELDLPESTTFIRSSTQKMDRLINAILRLSREGRRNLNPEPVQMAPLIEGVIASLKQQTDARGASIAIEGVLPDLVNDRLAVEQVFSNVVENALKYLKSGRPGRIVVRGHTAGAMQVYDIEDNGRGIDPKDHERVFELFRRSGAQDQPGEGIGLAHVRALVYRLGGTITVQSELDRGATFRICLPQVLAKA